MNRLQKKCVIATVGIHLLLLTILIVGPAFFNPQPKPDNTQLLDVIPPNLIDAAFNSGVKDVTPPPPQPAPPTPIVQPPPPVPNPVAPPPPTFMEKVEKIFKPEPVKPTPDLTPVEKPAKTEPRKIQVNTQLVTRTAPKNSPTTANPQRDTRAFNSVIKNLQKNLSPGTKFDMPGNSTVAYANYGAAVVSTYHQRWIALAPTGMEKDNAVVVFKVKIASDGTVISSSIVTPSGDAAVDRAVQRMLDSVSFIAAFPDGAAEKEREYTIDFNATKTSE